MIFNKMADTEDNYKFYRQRWCEAPGLPFLYPHTQGPRPERRRKDFFRFFEYVEWRSQGNQDDLESYVNYMSDTASAPGTRRSELPRRHHAAGSQFHLDLEKGSQADTQVITFARGEDKKSQRTCFTGLLSWQTSLYKSMYSWTRHNSMWFGLQGLANKLVADSQWAHTKLDTLVRPAITNLGSQLRTFCPCGSLSSESLFSDIEKCLSDLPHDHLTSSGSDYCSLSDQRLSLVDGSKARGKGTMSSLSPSQEPDLNLLKLQYRGIVAKMEPPSGTTTLGHVLPLK